MSPALIEQFRAAKDLIVTLREAPAKKVRSTWGEIFGKDPKASRGTPPLGAGGSHRARAPGASEPRSARRHAHQSPAAG